MKYRKIIRAGCGALLLAALSVCAVSCEGDSGGGDGGILAGKWVGFTISATNGISVTRDLVMRLSHSSADNITGTKKIGSQDAQPLVGTYFPATSVMEVSVATPSGNVAETWRLEEGGNTLTQVAGASAQVNRVD